MKIILPFPDKRLSPNARINRYALNAIKQEARQIGFFAAKESGLRLSDGFLQMKILIFPPDNRNRDDDNILASLKAARDGIFDALNINDNRVKISSHAIGKVKSGGAVYIWIEPLLEIPEWIVEA